MSQAFDSPATLVDHVVRACGGGRVLCLGPRAVELAQAFRRRAIEAVSDVDTAWTGSLVLGSHANRAYDIVVVEHVLATLDEHDRPHALAALLRVTGGAMLLREGGLSRLEWEREILSHGWRKHPLHQTLVPYQGIDWEGTTMTLLVEPLPQRLSVGVGLADLAIARDLHMDMLREGGRRADAHVARYMFARQFIRPGDRVLDAACGLGYGSAILADGTLAASVEGLDADTAAIEYASEHYGAGRSRLSFTTCDISALASRPSGTVDAIVSFETLEHIAHPDDFIATCQRILTPGGRLICSVPNEWLNDDGVDPNPYHLQVFNRARLEQECGRHFLIEHVYGQTAGGGMKLPDATRRLWSAEPGENDAEWWLLVGMTDPVQANAGPVRHGLTEHPVADATNVLAFDRDYTNAWLVRSMVTLGLRTESPELLTALANRALATGMDATADTGAALCIRAYRYLDGSQTPPEALFDAITEYGHVESTVPHVQRWQISLRYVEGLLRLQQGDTVRAVAALTRCAGADALTFSPLLATKTVGASFLLGWIALQTRDHESATRHWQAGIAHAERALHRPWDELMLDRTGPALFGLREAASIVDIASQCASGLALMPHAAERPGVVAAQLFESMQERLVRLTRDLAQSAGSPAPAKPSDADEEGIGAAMAVVDPTPIDVPMPEPAPPVWRMLDHLDQASLSFGEPEQFSAWDAVIDDEYSRNIFLHPPAIVESTIPFAEAGRLSAKVALHPGAWEQPGASGCHFTITVDSLAEASVLLDPHTVPSHRHWFDLVVHVPATGGAFHTLTLETRSVDAPHHGWALFRDVTFEPVIAAATTPVASDAPADTPAHI